MSKITPGRSRTITVIRRGRFQGTPLPGNKKPQGHVSQHFLWKRQQHTASAPEQGLQSRGAVPRAHTNTKVEGSLFPLGFWELVPFQGLGRARTLMGLYVCRRKRRLV